MSSDAPLPALLVVEDDESLRETLCELLELEGFRVETATNGAEALEAVQRMPLPCTVLLDMMMPVMDGGEFFRRLRAQLPHLTPQVRVIVVSAAGLLTPELEAARVPWVRKPFEVEHLIAQVLLHAGA